MTTDVARKEWLAERNQIPGVGASDAAALFGLHPYMSAFALFVKLVDPLPRTDEESEEENDVQSFGLAIEPYLANWYARKTKRHVAKPERSLYRLPERPYLFSSPDYVYWETNPEGVFFERGALELKSALYFDPSYPIEDHWQVQVQQQMLCMGLRKASFSILGGFRRRYHVDDIPRNDHFCEILVETVDRFMYAVKEGRWDAFGAEIDGSRATTEALRRLYPEEKGTTIELSADALSWADELARAKADAAVADALESSAKNKLLAAIGENTYAVLPDGRKYSLTTTKGSMFTVTRKDYRVLRLVKEGK